MTQEQYDKIIAGNVMDNPNQIEVTVKATSKEVQPRTQDQLNNIAAVIKILVALALIAVFPATMPFVLGGVVLKLMGVL